MENVIVNINICYGIFEVIVLLLFTIDVIYVNYVPLYISNFLLMFP